MILYLKYETKPMHRAFHLYLYYFAKPMIDGAAVLSASLIQFQRESITIAMKVYHKLVLDLNKLIGRICPGHLYHRMTTPSIIQWFYAD